MFAMNGEIKRWTVSGQERTKPPTNKINSREKRGVTFYDYYLLYVLTSHALIYDAKIKVATLTLTESGTVNGKRAIF